MVGWLAKRLLGSFLVLLFVSFFAYALIGLMPGDPFDLMLASNPDVTTADVLRLKALYGLDRPLPERWWAWLGRVISGDLGYSRLYSVGAASVLLPRLGATLLLMGTSLLLAVSLALLFGTMAALRPGSRTDRLISAAAIAGYSVPSFWLALLLIILFAVELGWLPAGGVASPGGGDLLDRARHLVLPATTLTVLTTGGFLRGGSSPPPSGPRSTPRASSSRTRSSATWATSWSATRWSL